MNSSPLKWEMGFPIVIDPQDGFSLRAWQLTLSQNAIVRVPPNIGDSFFAIVWQGTAGFSPAALVQWSDTSSGLRIVKLEPGMSIAGTSADTNAVVAVIGIADPGLTLPTEFVGKGRCSLPAPSPTDDRPLTGIIRLLDFHDSEPTEAESWSQSAFVISTVDGPQPATRPCGGPSTEGDRELDCVEVPAGEPLQINPGSSGDETVAIVCDFYAEGDPGGIEDGCKWRCWGY